MICIGYVNGDGYNDVLVVVKGCFLWVDERDWRVIFGMVSSK